MALFRGRIDKVDIIHKFPIDAPAAQQKTTTLSLTTNEWKGNMQWGIKMRQGMGGNTPQQEQLFLAVEDTELLMVILTECVKKMYRL